MRTLMPLAAIVALAGGEAVDPATGLAAIAIPPEHANASWPAELERGFQERCRLLFQAFPKPAVNTTLENEKGSYPATMCAYLAGDAAVRAEALRLLQLPDADGGDHAHTMGIDWYWSFTIKGQVRKFFLFGPGLEPAYRQRMLDAARLWTADDPRPSFELVLLLDSADAQVRGHALALLRQCKANIEAAVAGADGQRMRASGAGADTRILAAVARFQGQDFGEDRERWRAWWSAFAAEGWEVFEDVERLMNPRPHPAHGRGRPGAIGKDFSPGARGYWVDGRNTDNLRAMRETSVYLMAEASGNDLVRRIYKEQLKRYVTALYRIGMGEWDSENYCAHTTMPYHSLYDFARDGEVRLLAKAALDWLYCAQALKYRHGGFGGPTKRDYGGASRQWGSTPAQLLWLWAGDTPKPPHEQHADAVHAATSAYRPPLAVLGLMRKDFPTPVELLDTKPTYSNWLPGDDAAPETFETMWYAKHAQLGSCVSKGAAGDVGNVKLLADAGAIDAQGRCDVQYVLLNSGRKMNSKNAGDQVGQHGNLLVFLRRATTAKGPAEIAFQLPAGVAPEIDGERWWIALERCWLCVHALNLAAPAGPVAQGGRKGGAGDPLWIAKPQGEGFCGVAIEVGDAGAFADLAAFKAAVAAKGSCDRAALAEGRVQLVGSDGRRLAVTWNAENDLPRVERDGVARDWTREFDLYRPTRGEGPISLGWKQGALTVRAGGKIFTQTVTAEGAVTFTER